MTRPAAPSWQPPAGCQSVRGNPDSHVAPSGCLAASEQDREAGSWVASGIPAPVSHPHRVRSSQGLSRGWLRVRYSGKAELQAFLSLSLYVQIITWLICLSLAKLIFLLRSASWVIKTAQPMVNSTQQVFIKPSSGGTRKVRDTVLPGYFRLRG